MIEERTIELDGIGLAALVLRMAGAALALGGIGMPTVEAATVVAVGFHLLVTGETQSALRVAGEWGVARLAFVFVLGVLVG